MSLTAGPDMPKRATAIFDAIVIDRTSNMPIHRQIYARLRSLIVGGKLSPGSKLPATRQMANILKVGRNTAIAAYEQLLAEGYLESELGAGTFVAKAIHGVAEHRDRARPDDGLHLSRRGTLIRDQPRTLRLPRRINLQPGFPDTDAFPFSTWSKLLARNARHRADELMGFYGYSGHPELREVIAEYVSISRGVSCVREQVIIVTGAQAALDLLSRALIDEGDVAWMEEPGYIGARTSLLGSGARLMPLKVKKDGWQFRDPSLLPPRLIYVTPSCQWPLGEIMRLEQRIELLKIAERHSSWIIEDDYDGEYRFRGKPVSALQGLDWSGRVIYIGTFGKTLFQSLRLGFMVVPENLIESLDRVVYATGHFAPTVLQTTLADFIREGHFSTHLRKARILYENRQSNFIHLCNQHLSQWMQVRENDSGIQMLGRFTQPMDDQELTELAISFGVNCNPLSPCYYFGEPLHGLLFGYAGVSDRDLNAAVLGLKKAFQQLENHHMQS